MLNEDKHKNKIFVFAKNQELSYQLKPICSVSSMVCGNVLFKVSGNIKTRKAATRDKIPNKTVGRLIHNRV